MTVQHEGLIASEQDTRQLLEMLVGIPSVNPKDRSLVASTEFLGEHNIAVAIRDRLRGKGIQADLQEIEPGRTNVFARLGNSHGPRLLLDGHLDTVAAENLMRESFIPRLERGRLFGVGAADDKASVAAMILALEGIQRLGIQLAGSVVFAGVAGEEGPPSGTDYLLRHGLRVDGAIVGEPTELELCIGQKGGQFVELTTEGLATHGSIPHRGINAIDKMCALLQGLSKLPIFQEEHELFGRSTVNVGTIRGGVRTNIVPDRCTATIDVRLVPGHDLDRLARELGDYLQKLRERDGSYQAKFFFPERGSQAVLSPKEAPVIKAVAQAYAEVRGDNPAYRIAPFWTDAEYLINAGIPTVIIGPGSVEHCHRPDEYVELGQVIDAAMIYFRSILAFCGISA